MSINETSFHISFSLLAFLKATYYYIIFVFLKLVFWKGSLRPLNDSKKICALYFKRLLQPVFLFILLEHNTLVIIIYYIAFLETSFQKQESWLELLMCAWPCVAYEVLLLIGQPIGWCLYQYAILGFSNILATRQT